MVRIKLEGLSLVKKGPSEPASLEGGMSSVTGAVLNAPSSIAKGALAVGGVVGDGVSTILTTGITGVFTFGKGFRDFILRGTVVELAVAVVLGTAFTNLISAVTSDWILPLIGAIFQGTQFTELYFTINYSQFRYGHFINEFFVFLLVCFILYVGVVIPLNKLQYAAFKHKAIMRDCPRCLEEISMAATRCRYCCADIELDAEVKAVLEMAEAAMEAEQQKQHWFWRFCSRCLDGKKAVLSGTSDGDVQLNEVKPAVLPRSKTIALSRTVTFIDTGRLSAAGSQRSAASPEQPLSPATSVGGAAPLTGGHTSYTTAVSSPSESFRAAGPSEGEDTAIDISALQAKLDSKSSR